MNILSLQQSNENLTSLLDKILLHVREITNADAGSIYLADQDNKNLTLHIFQNDTFANELEDEIKLVFQNSQLPIVGNSENIAIESFVSGKAINIDDVYNQKNYNFQGSKKFDKKFTYVTKSILTIPIIDKYSKTVIGVVQIINKIDNGKRSLLPFTAKDQEYLLDSSFFMALSIISTLQKIKLENKTHKQLEDQISKRTLKLEVAKDKLLSLANKDALTNLYNRRYFKEIITQLLPRISREKSSLSVVMIDIDNFKSINDSFGHNIGDIVIQNLASLIQHNYRQADIAVRTGGEEFLILMPDTSINNARQASEKLRASIENEILTINNNEKLTYTVSLGMTKYNSNDKNIEETLHRADLALYKAKKEGKNKLCIKV